MNRELSDLDDARQSHIEALKQASKGDRWMAAVWMVDSTPAGPRVVLVGRTTYGFPVSDFLTAVSLLADNLVDEQRELSIQGRPLPRVELKPAPKLVTEEADDLVDEDLMQ